MGWIRKHRLFNGPFPQAKAGLIETNFVVAENAIGMIQLPA